MQVQQIPAGTKIYSTLARACRYGNALPGGVQPVWENIEIKKTIGWAVLSARFLWVA